MNLMKYILFVVLLCLALISASQSDLLFNNYRINAVARNPAAIENNGSINAYLGIHQQWVGFEDAPNMQWAHVSNFFDKRNMGISLNILSQSVGATLTQNIKLGYSYHIFFRGGHNLSLGLGAGLYSRNFDLSKLRFEENEQNNPVSMENEIHPDFDFGLEYTYQKLTIGLASNHITILNSKATLFKIPMQNNVYANYTVGIIKYVSIIPGINFFNSGTISSLGVSMDFLYNDLFNAGIAYRSGTSLIIRAGVKISSSFQFSYSYDMGSGSFTTYNSGVHEVVITARFKKRSESFNSPRFID